MHPADLQAAVINTRDFEAAELKANYIQTSSNTESLFKSRSISTHLSANDAAANLSTTSISNSNLSAAATSNLSITATSNLSTPTNSNTATNYTSKRNPWTENDTAKLKIGNEETINTSLFSKAALEEKPITAMYTDVKVDGHSIKLILDSSLTGSIITKQLMDQLDYQVDQTASARIIIANSATKTPIGEIDNLPFEINDIITPIKVLVIEATQYQALVGNNWLSKTNVMLDWTTQELQINQNGQYT
ncbi:hypothetical protein G9A89_013581 [Geosiphon pyriformis]|nr:hypothetical protein G9A89_013581 [Geosiphon pyriformis]